MRVHLIYLCILAVVAYVAVVNVVKVRELSQGKGVYVANLGELQQRIQQSITAASGAQSDRRAYDAHLNRLLEEGRIRILRGDNEVKRLAFTPRIIPDLADGRREIPSITMDFAAPGSAFGRPCDGISFAMDAVVSEGWLQRPAAP